MASCDPLESYDQALAYLCGLSAFGIKPGLERMEALLALMGNPERRSRFVHIGGTNGKGSVVTVMDALLREMGWRTGCFISPHMYDWRERIRCGGRMICREDMLRGVNIVRPLAASLPAWGLEHPTEFEVSTALAFWYFAERCLDIVLLEVGLGGAIDSTNVIRPEVVVLTSVGMDHMEYLGETLAEIAGVKAGIVKDRVPVVMSEQDAEVVSVIEEACQRCAAPLIRVQLREEKSAVTSPADGVCVLRTDMGKDSLCEEASEQGWPPDGGMYAEACAVPLPSLTPDYTSCFKYYGVTGLGGSGLRPANDGPANDELAHTQLTNNVLSKSELANNDLDNGERRTVVYCEVRLVGRHQIQNAATALAAVEVLLNRYRLSPFSSEKVRQALLGVMWPGRTELLMCSRPDKTVRVLLDGAHNEEGMRALAQVLERGFSRRRLVFCFGMLEDKAVEKALKWLLPLGDAFVTTRVPSERAGNWKKVTDLVKAAGHLCREEEKVAEAVGVALDMCGEEDLLCVTGSLYMMGEARSVVLEPCPTYSVTTP